MTQRRGIILLEGPDCSGKTTLARHLVEHHGARYIHCRRDRNIWRLQTAALRLAAEWAQTQLVVLDRHWISECIYGRVFRGGSAFPHSARSMHRMLERFGTLTVLCLPPVEWVVERHAERHARGGEDFPSVREVATRYHDLAYGSIIRPTDGDYVEELSARGGCVNGGWTGTGTSGREAFTLYDASRVIAQRYPKAATEREARRLLNLLDKRVAGIRPFFYSTVLSNLAGRVAYLGGQREPLTVLIGDRVSDPRCAVTWPFYANSGSSEYLNKQLQLAGIPESRVALVNGWDPGGAVTLAAIRKMRPETRFVALGERAAQSQGTDFKLYAKIRHPQHAYRFTYHDDSYRKELADAILGN